MTNVAVACQGGGSHTAFTAGALTRLLPAVAVDDDRRLVGISETSGGAISGLTEPTGPSRRSVGSPTMWASAATGSRPRTNYAPEKSRIVSPSVSRSRIGAYPQSGSMFIERWKAVCSCQQPELTARTPWYFP